MGWVEKFANVFVRPQLVVYDVLWWIIAYERFFYNCETQDLYSRKHLLDFFLHSSPCTSAFFF